VGNAHIPYDIELFHYPLLAVLKTHVAAGSLPVWDPDTYGGIPLLPNSQVAWLYPPHLAIDGILALLGAPFSQRVLQSLAILHVWIAGMGMCLLARERSMSSAAAAFAGAFAVLNGEVVAQSQHLGMVEALAWLPLAVLVVDRLHRGITAARVAALAALFFLMVTAGFLPLILSCAALLVAYAAIAPAGRRSALVGTVAGMGLGAGMAAALLLPLLSVLSYFPKLDPHRALATSDLVTTVIPNAFGHWLGTIGGYTGAHGLTNSYYYVGAGAVVALPLALASGRRVARDAVVALAMLLLAFGAVAAAVAGIVQDLPSFGTLYRPEDFAYVATVPVALALAQAFNGRPSQRQIAALGAFLVALVLVPFGTGGGMTSHVLGSAPRRELLGVVLVGGLALVAWRASDDRWRRGALALLVIAGALELASAVPSRYFVNASGPAMNAGIPAGDPRAPVFAFLRRTLRPDERIAADQKHLSSEWTGFSPLWGLPNANGFQPQFSRYQLERVSGSANGGVSGGDRIFPITPAQRPYLREMNVRYVVVSATADSFAHAPGFTLAYRDPFFHVYHVDGAQSRAYEVSAACLRRGGGDALLACTAAPASTTILSDTDRRLDLGVSRRTRLVVAGEPYYPGWEANGPRGPLAVRRIGYMTAVSVPPGVDRVTLRYRPPGFVTGLVVTLLCMSIACIAGVRWVRTRRLRSADG
jgi:hypothetical protein